MKSPRIAPLAMFATVVFGSVETAFADIAYSFTTIDFPGTDYTQANGINNSGQILGSYYLGGIWHGFLDTGGGFTTIDFPGANNTHTYGINDSGQIVGLYGESHGFLATPTVVPEPGSLPLL